MFHFFNWRCQFYLYNGFGHPTTLRLILFFQSDIQRHYEMNLKLKMNGVTWYFDSGPPLELDNRKIFVSLKTKYDFCFFMLNESEFDRIMKMASKITTVEELTSEVKELRCS